MGLQVEAEESINRALAIEPTNAELLLALQKEIRIIIAEALQEKQMLTERENIAISKGAVASLSAMTSPGAVPTNVFATTTAAARTSASAAPAGAVGESKASRDDDDILESAFASLTTKSTPSFTAAVGGTVEVEEKARHVIDALCLQLKQRCATATAATTTTAGSNNSTAAAECKHIQDTHAACRQLLDYFKTHSNLTEIDEGDIGGNSASCSTGAFAAGSDSVVVPTTSGVTKIKMYVRTSGLLLLVVECIRSVSASLISVSEVATDKAIVAKLTVLMCELLTITAHTCSKQRAAQLVAVEGKLIPALKQLLSFEGTSDHVILAVLELMHCLSKNDTCPKAQLQVLADKALLSLIGNVMDSKAYSLVTALKAAATSKTASASGNTNSNSNHSSNMQIVSVSVLLYGARIIKSCSFNESGKNCLSLHSNVECGSPIVCALSTALHQVTLCGSGSSSLWKDDPEAPVQLREDTIEALVGALLGCSQLESLRSFFAIELAVCDPAVIASASSVAAAGEATVYRSETIVTDASAAGGGDDKKGGRHVVRDKEVLLVSAIGSVLLLMKHSSSVYESNCLAVLMNICCVEATGAHAGVGGDGSVSNSNRLLVAESGCLEMLLSYLCMDDAQRSRVDGSILLSRAGCWVVVTHRDHAANTAISYCRKTISNGLPPYCCWFSLACCCHHRSRSDCQE